MRRRDFLRSIAVGAASVAVTAVAGPKLVTLATELVDDPDRLNWVPGKKRIFDLWPKHGYDLQKCYFSVAFDPNRWDPEPGIKELVDLQRHYNYLQSQLREYLAMSFPAVFFNTDGSWIPVRDDRVTSAIEACRQFAEAKERYLFGGKTKAEIADDYLRDSVGPVANWFSPGYKPMSVRTGRLP